MQFEYGKVVGQIQHIALFVKRDRWFAFERVGEYITFQHELRNLRHGGALNRCFVPLILKYFIFKCADYIQVAANHF